MGCPGGLIIESRPAWARVSCGLRILGADTLVGWLKLRWGAVQGSWGSVHRGPGVLYVVGQLELRQALARASWGALHRGCLGGAPRAKAGMSQKVLDCFVPEVPWPAVWSRSGVGQECSGVLCTCVTLE